METGNAIVHNFDCRSPPDRQTRDTSSRDRETSYQRNDVLGLSKTLFELLGILVSHDRRLGINNEEGAALGDHPNPITSSRPVKRARKWPTRSQE